MADPALLQSLADDPSSLDAMTANADLVRGDVVQAAAATLALYHRTGVAPPWMSYFARWEGDIAGICSLAAPPVQGVVEIAYFTFAPYEGRGIASAMAAELLRIALAQPEVSAVCAHTAPEENASTHILRKLGFIRDGLVQDDEIGEAWRWLRKRAL